MNEDEWDDEEYDAGPWYIHVSNRTLLITIPILLTLIQLTSTRGH